MRYLLDTHIILWELIGDKRLSKDARKIIEDGKNEIYYSTASAWEIEIKHLNREDFKLSAEQFIFLCDQNGIANISIKNSNILKIKDINKVKNTKHNDPFDKMLLAQAMSENMILITHDKKFEAYSNPNIMLV